MSEKQEPKAVREWTLFRHPDDPNMMDYLLGMGEPVPWDKLAIGERCRVIEKSAYDALKAELEQCRGVLNLKEDEYVQQIGTWKVIQRLEEERDALAKENAELKAELDERDQERSFASGVIHKSAIELARHKRALEIAKPFVIAPTLDYDAEAQINRILKGEADE